MVGQEEFLPQQASFEDDLRYSGAFWERLRDAHWTREQIERKKAQMSEVIEQAAESGSFQTIVQMGLLQISDRDREKLSAYRVMAHDLGYEIGGWKYTARSGSVKAPIRKLNIPQV